MRARRLLASPLAGLLLAACSSNGTPTEETAAEPTAGPGLVSYGFDATSGGLPPGWLTGTANARAGGADAVWEQVADPTAPSQPNALALVDALGHVGQTFNLCWLRAPSFRDLEVSVAVHVSGGEEDQGGGPAWRIGSAQDYYTARWNPLEDNFRVYSVVGGERLQLDSARVFADAADWHTIRVRHVGGAITCWFDGEELLHADDAKLSGAGAVGLWTKADATTRFDDLVVRGLDPGR